ncbi:hypothetical protein CAPTEDRAFT_186961 [Capitella teleta]|uniref:Mab-21-like nucleotidyltransferase domain-containing protein n=1 Tax=Capitella teleta TaxID=283909 RepID=R7VAH7_CAPTE|nr:hypothetical protein CAPTEDRAFT_186961 [Capitella teleta]|eukprot:ELU15614.1 hypothetical protein CAPTEDRAFT_186961 [Capitella teleta]
MQKSRGGCEGFVDIIQKSDIFRNVWVNVDQHVVVCIVRESDAGANSTEYEQQKEDGHVDPRHQAIPCRNHRLILGAEEVKMPRFTSLFFHSVEFSEVKQIAGENNVEAVFASLLKSPVLGTRIKQENCFKEEGRLVINEVLAFMKRFSEQFGRQYSLLVFDPKLRGSMGEDTKCGFPDEFDFMLLLDKISDNCQVISINNCKANIGMLTFPAIRDEVSPFEINLILHILIKKLLLTHSIWKESHLKFVSCERMNVGLCLNLVFNGHLYKLLHISIDLVPSIPLKIPVHVSIDWSVPLDFSKCQLYGLFRDGYDGLDLSSTDYEEVLLKSLPSAAIDAYVLGKAFGSAHFKWTGKRLAQVFRKSYTMKKALLISLQQHKIPQEVSRHEWINEIVSVVSNMEKYAKKNECRRCIFHAEYWVLGEKDCLNLSF